ncbi:MAG TPA: hypothetical protein PKM17_12185 [Syntrophorhabdus sp.]|nr:hypothetical protein [Syntrophorhabdus sp.]
MIKQNKALQNLKRNLFRQAINYQAGTNFIEDKGVFTYLALWHFFADPTDENAVYYVICELENERKKLEYKEVPKDRWPKFLQKEDWKEQTYLKFCVPYPGKVHETTEVTPELMNTEQRVTATGWSKVGDVIPRAVNDIGKRELI